MSQALTRRTETAVTLRTLVDSPAYKSRFNEVLRDRAPQFVASLVQLVNASKQLQECEPNTVIAAAITAARKGARVLLLEKGRFPRHKVCGEFVSPESLRLLTTLLGRDAFVNLPQITSARIFVDGKKLTIPVSPSARSIPRYELDSSLLTTR